MGNIPFRHIQKHDIEANWILFKNFVPKSGEVIVYDPDNNYSRPRFKIGDGITTINNLPFVTITSTGTGLIINQVNGNTEIGFDDTITFVLDGGNADVAGLYKSNGDLVASWDELGANISSDYTSSTASSASKSLYYRLNNVYADAYAEGNLELILPDNIERIGNYALYSCNKIKSIYIPANIKTIGTYAFYNCDVLTDLKFNPNTKFNSLGSYAFYSCRDLTSVGPLRSQADIELPNTLTAIKSSTFQSCDNLKTVDFSTFDNLKTIGAYAFRSNPKLQSVKFSENCNLSFIGEYAFRGCNALTSIGPAGSGSSVELPNNNISFDDQVFSECTGLINIELPDNITTPGTRMFLGCTNLEQVKLPSNFTEIGYMMFKNCSKLSNITIPQGATLINYEAFYGCSSLTGTITIPSTVTVIDTSAFYNCTGIKKFVFEDNSQLTTINSNAFKYCTGYDVDFGNNSALTTINRNWFEGREINSVRFGENSKITSIPNYAFQNSGLTKVDLPSSITAINYSAFYGCASLIEFICRAVTPPSLGNYALSQCSKLATIKVPAESVDAYKSASGWSSYSSKIVAIEE